MIKGIVAAAAWLALAGLQNAAGPTPDLALWRLDCGKIIDTSNEGPPWRNREATVSCYLIRHGERYMLWDAGLSVRALGKRVEMPGQILGLDRTIADQLAEIGVKPEQVSIVGISHYHGDHTGQASLFPKAKLVIGAGDFAAYKAEPIPQGVARQHLKPWLEDGAPVEAAQEDFDIFGDGRVMMLRMPGHTPGHSALLVKLAGGAVLLSGDLYYSRDDVLNGRMPAFNTSRAETLASRDYFTRLAHKHDATVVIQHERDDIARLPRFPQAAR